jgi:hypothetical protein
LGTLTLSVWELVLGTVVLLGLPLLVRRILSRRIMARKAARSAVVVGEEKLYEKEWGVLWPWPPINKYWYGKNPVCPVHGLVLSMHRPYHLQPQFVFRCRGVEGEPPHEYRGPTEEQLDGLSLHADVFDRINARLQWKPPS